MKGGVRIAPSVLSADLVRLADQIQEVEAGGADWIHVDVMDGHFVPNLTFGAKMIEAISRVTRLPIDVHLMVEHPERYIAPFADAGAAIFTFHPEATRHAQRQARVVRERGMRPGIALNPGTPLGFVEEIIADLDLVLIMTVNPGYAAQEFIPASLDKIARARALLTQVGSSAVLEVDGGIALDTIAQAHAAGADTFVAGSAIFGSDDPGRQVQELRKRCLVEV